MSPANPIEGFLHAHAYSPSGEASRQLDRVRPFVTISRQAGAGGHTLARTLIEVFNQQDDKELFAGWEMFDQKLVAMVADDPELRVSVESLLGEEYHRTADDYFRQLFSATTQQDIVMDRIFRLVRMLAEVGKSVIVGRAGSEVTRGMGPSVSVRLVAPEEFRMQRMMEVHGLDEKKAHEAVTKHEAGRSRLLKRHFHANIDDPFLYDAIWNTSSAPINGIAQSIVALLRDKAAGY